jgi:hypothetical protein
MVVDMHAWGSKDVDRLRLGLYWSCCKDAKGGHCHVAWGKVCRLLELGGLSISSLKELGWVLRMRWLWLEKNIS